MNLPQYKPHPEREARIASAKEAMSAIVPLALYPAHKRELLGVCLWKITEADGKLKVRYWSEGALTAVKKDLRHEHVYERKKLISRLLSGEAIESVVSDAIACIVTKREHESLSASEKSGWERYVDVGIRVFDLAAQAMFIDRRAIGSGHAGIIKSARE